MSEDPDLERLLRRALHEHAAQIMPSGDGLQRIQGRVGRRRHLHWLRPAMATLAAAAAAVAMIAVPSLFDNSSHHDGSTAAQQQQQHVLASPRSAATPAPTTPAPKLTVAQPAVWPYGSVDQAGAASAADARAGDLSRPQALATDLVESFTGTGQLNQLKLATQVIHKGPLTEVAVRRFDSGLPVCTMTLARVPGRDRAYVITDAVSANVQIGGMPDLRKLRGPVTVSGIVSPAKTSQKTLRVEIRDAGQRSPGTGSAGYYNTKGVPDQAWDATINPLDQGELWPRHPIIAAWIVDKAGLPVGFTAQPAQGPEPLPTD